jgi:hypothetical protein
MNTYIEQVQTIIRPVEIQSLSSFTWYGEKQTIAPHRMTRHLPEDVLKECLVSALQWRLYIDAYCQGFPRFVGFEPNISHTSIEEAVFALELSKANLGKGQWDSGWLVVAIDSDHVLVAKNGLLLRAATRDCRPPPTGKGSIGKQTQLYLPKELPMVSPAFYLTLGEFPLFSPGDTEQLVRLYINVTSEGATHLLKKVGKELNRCAIPFRLKILKGLVFFRRTDAAVLYFKRQDYTRVFEILNAANLADPRFVRGGIPAFTKAVGPGCGIAENPPTGASFGLHRCRLLAEALTRAFDDRKESEQSLLATITTRFSEEGLDLERPYINPGSRDYFRLRLQKKTSPQSRSQARSRPPSFLEIAFQLGTELSQRAFWHEGKCTWVGASLQNAHAGERFDSEYIMLGPDLYGGTSGIALFLAELASRTNHSGLRRTALGAIYHALDSHWQIPKAKIGSLFEGSLGIALVAAQIGKCLSEPGVVERAQNLTATVENTLEEGEEMDLLAGTASSILALSILAQTLRRPTLLKRARHLADEILRCARVEGLHYSWDSVGSSRNPALLGFSHGAAGIAYALLELYRTAKASKNASNYLTAIKGAFAYEDSWFSEEDNNWPDLRGQSLTRLRRVKGQLPYVTYWCHGAPGIALSRLRALELLNDEVYKPHAFKGLENTRHIVEQALSLRRGNFSLCHGLSGNAIVLLEAHRVLGDEFPHGEEYAREVGRFGARTYGICSSIWPLGVDRLQSFGLMCGLAGVGYFYLCLHDSKVPSILMPRGESLL